MSKSQRRNLLLKIQVIKLINVIDPTDLGKGHTWVPLVPSYILTSAKAAQAKIDVHITEFTEFQTDKKGVWKQMQVSHKEVITEAKECLRRCGLQIEEAKKISASDM